MRCKGDLLLYCTWENPRCASQMQSVHMLCSGGLSAVRRIAFRCFRLGESHPTGIWTRPVFWGGYRLLSTTAAQPARAITKPAQWTR